ncbi:arginine deiminase family protein [Pseudomonas syringae]|uniref:arginine deiminase family protein n=1 Tax=Pseudomonas syringae TaxID=317 RepID=UPI0018E5F227|nr:arginine deiminase family protein [Pseudomonas syringae]MBI6721182.1 amidinotransferase [Pseudomonas syringae]MBI6757641.1 amidinotransferase [Pseudomonas syringae]
MKVLLQLPSVVQPVSMSIFMESQHPYSLRQADADVMALASSFNAAGFPTVFLSDALFSEDGPHVAIEDMRQLARRALRFADNVEPGRQQLAHQQLLRCSRQELAEIIINQPELRLHYDDELGRISPDATYESYRIQPLYGLLFPRDHFMNVGGQPVFGRLKRQDRAREVDVVKQVVAAHGHVPVELDQVLEGGDYLENEHISLINTGFRTEAPVLEFLLTSSLLKGEVVLAVQDIWRNPEQFHLDHYACLLRDALLIDATRADAADRSLVSVYRRMSSVWQLTGKDLTFRQAAQVAGIGLIPLDDEMMAAWCANAFSLGNHVWIDQNAPVRLLDQLAELDCHVRLIAFTEHQKQFGGIHCATQLL